MTNLEYWKQRIAESVDGQEFYKAVFDAMNDINRYCDSVDIDDCLKLDCADCRKKFAQEDKYYG